MSQIIDNNDFVSAATFASGTVTLARGSLADLTVDISAVNTDTNKFLSGLSLSGTTITAAVTGGTNQTLDIASINTDTNKFLSGLSPDAIFFNRESAKLLKKLRTCNWVRSPELV